MTVRLILGDSRDCGVAIQMAGKDLPLGMAGRLRLRGPSDQHQLITNGGIYPLNPDVCLQILLDQPYDIPDLIVALVTEGRSVSGFPVHQCLPEIGQAEDYQRAQEHTKGGIS